MIDDKYIEVNGFERLQCVSGVLPSLPISYSLLGKSVEMCQGQIDDVLLYL